MSVPTAWVSEPMMAGASGAPRGTPVPASPPVTSRGAMFAAISGDAPGPVMVAVDGTDLAERSAQVAARLAHARGATLVLVRAIPGTARHGLFAYLLEDRARWVEEARSDLRQLAAGLRDGFAGLRVEMVVADGPPGTALVDAMRRAGAALAVVATRGRPAITRTFGGSVAGAIARDLGAATLVLWPTVVEDLTTDAWRDDTLVAVSAVPVGRRVLLPAAHVARHPRLVAEAFRLARDAGGEVVVLVGPDGTSGAVGARLTDVAGRVGRDARVVGASTDGWFGIAAAVAREDCDAVALPAVAAVPGTRPGLASVHRDVVTRAQVPLLCVPDLPDGERRGLAALYPDLPLPLLDAARRIGGR